jgi:hypothetical protein
VCFEISSNGGVVNAGKYEITFSPERPSSNGKYSNLQEMVEAEDELSAIFNNKSKNQFSESSTLYNNKETESQHDATNSVCLYNNSSRIITNN